MALTLTACDGVKLKVVDLTKSLIRYTNETFSELPDVSVVLVDIDYLPIEANGVNEVVHGCFFWWSDGRTPEIQLAARAPRKKAQYDKWRIDFVDTYFHELAHFMQYATGKRITEIGVAVRAKNLLKQAVNNSETLRKRIYE
jgi:hypothetical protein